MKSKEIPLIEGKFYHIYNRGNNKQNIFYSYENYKYFLRKYDEYLSEYVDTYAYCLLPNHFHLLVSVKENIKVSPSLELLPVESGKVPPFEKVVPLERDISFQFRKFLTSYAMSINKQEERTGSLFQKNFQRIEITDTNYLTNLIFYIHANPQLHGIIDDFRMYPWSSYNGIIAGKPTKLKKENVLDWFNDAENYIAYHSQKADIAINKHLIFEEE